MGRIDKVPSLLTIFHETITNKTRLKVVDGDAVSTSELRV